MNRVYVYYRVAAGQETALRNKLPAFFAEVQRFAGVHPRLSQRADDSTTWMEIYEPVAEGHEFVLALDGLAQRHGLGAHVAQGTVRHTEQFVDADPL